MDAIREISQRVRANVIYIIIDRSEPMTNTAVWKNRPLSYGLRDTDDDGVFQDQ